MIEIDPKTPFQLGRTLYETQCLFADAEKGIEHIPVDGVKQLCKNYCFLVNNVGMLRGEFDSLETKYNKLVDKIKHLIKDL